MDWEVHFEPNDIIDGWDCVISLQNRVIKDCGATHKKALQATMMQLSQKGLDSFMDWAKKNNFDVCRPCGCCSENGNSSCCFSCKK